METKADKNLKGLLKAFSIQEDRIEQSLQVLESKIHRKSRAEGWGTLAVGREGKEVRTLRLQGREAMRGEAPFPVR